MILYYRVWQACLSKGKVLSATGLLRKLQFIAQFLLKYFCYSSVWAKVAILFAVALNDPQVNVGAF